MPKEIEDPMKLLDRMFAEYQLDEYLPAWEAMKAEHNRVCADNWNMRVGGKKDGKGQVA